MKRSNIYFILIILLLSCKDGTFALDKGDSVMVYNNSTKGIYAYLAVGGRHTAYPDTLLPAAFENASIQLIPKGFRWPFSTENWKALIMSLPKDTLSVFIIDPDTVAHYSWKVIRENNKILKRYDLSVHDLERTGYKVFYP